MALNCTVIEGLAQFLPTLGQHVGAAKIVILNTQSHGAGSDYVIMREIVKYLHAQHGFSALCMASGLYDGLKIAQNAPALPLRQRIAGSLFRMYANAAELVDLFDYIELHEGSEHALNLSGVDVPMGGLYCQQHLLAELCDYLDVQQVDRSGLADFFRLCQAYLSLQPVDHPDRQAIMGDGFAQLENALRGLQDKDAAFWQLMLSNLQARYRYTELGQSRDPQMAENFRYIHESMHAGQKIILWGHASHGLPMEGNLGGFVKSWYGDDAYVCHLTGHEGSMVNFQTGANTAIAPAPQGHLEQMLSSMGVETALLTAASGTAKASAGSLMLDDDLQIRLLAYATSCPLSRVLSVADARGLIDAVVFTSNIVPTVQH
ncbi:hypothetical protein IGB42_01981 [Andreprevotia sp. IGB-42]|uniref:erythromycin esterase family protein n=1 Tax=Andreprevotia sp. IGB-42 TaxID=2497473 RepID=UPI00135BD9A4|nr:erythromycin esterase family protein [Andreprevotia sp. IGB-42]KAF0813630.1 hypothetical protein IGB42_01981 [Andreprevotia sp. IGB-42]